MSKKRDKVKIRDKTNRDKLKVRGTGPKQDKKGTILHDRPLSTLRTAKPVNVCHRPDGLEVSRLGCTDQDQVCHRPDGLEAFY